MRKNTSILFLEKILSRGEVGKILSENGFELAEDPPWTDGIRKSTWRRGENESITFLFHAPSGRGVFILPESQDKSLEFWLGSTFPVMLPARLLARAQAAHGVAEHVQAMFDLGVLLRLGVASSQALGFLCQGLQHPDTLIRWAACRILREYPQPAVAQAFARAAQTHPDLRCTANRVAQAAAMCEQDMQEDAPTDDPEQLARRAEAGIRAQKTVRVRNAAEGLLKLDLEDPQAHLYMAQASKDSPLEMAAHAGAVLEILSLDKDSLRKPQTAIQKKAFSLLKNAHGLAPELSAEAFVRSAEAVWERIRQCEEEGAATAQLGMVNGVLPVARDWGDAFLFVKLRNLARAKNLVALAQQVPDSFHIQAECIGLPYCPPGFYKRIEERLRNPDAWAPTSLTARLIARLYEGKTEQLEVLTASIASEQAFSAGDFDTALFLSKWWAQREPQNALAWMRAIASLLNLRRFDDALRLFRQVIEHMHAGAGPIFSPEDRSRLEYFGACAAAMLGRREEALTNLRRAVRRDRHLARKAVRDVFFASLYEDAVFGSIVRCETKALLEPYELQPQYIQELIAAHSDHQSRNAEKNVERLEHALQLAKIIENPYLQAQAQAGIAVICALWLNKDKAKTCLRHLRRLSADYTLPAPIARDMHFASGILLHNERQNRKAAEAFSACIQQLAEEFGDESMATLPARILRLHAWFSSGELTRAMDELALCRTIVENELANLEDDPEAQVSVRMHAAKLLLYDALVNGHLKGFRAALPSLDDAFAHMAWISRREGGLPEEIRPFAWQVLDELQEDADGGVANVDDPDDAVISRFQKRLRQWTDEDDASRNDDETSGPLPIDEYVQAEKNFWMRFRRIVRSMMRGGVGAGHLAQWLLDAMSARNPEKLELKEVAFKKYPELLTFGQQLAKRAKMDPVFGAVAHIAFSQAAQNGDILGKLKALEEFFLMQMNEWGDR